MVGGNWRKARLDRLDAMQIFVLVAEEGGFAAAGRRLGLAKSTVSKQIRALEDRLGLRLVNRDSRRLALTAAGEEWLAACRRVLAELEEAEGRLSAHTGEPRGKLRVSAPMTFGLLHLSPLLPRFSAAHPQIGIELVLDDRRVDLLAEGYDMAVRIGRLPDSSLIARRLGGARSRCVASPAYLARRGRPRHPRELGGHECLRYLYGRDAQGWVFEKAGERILVPVRGRFAANNGEVLRDAAVAGLGVARLPAFIVDPDLRAGRLEALLEDWSGGEVDIHVVYPPHRGANPAVAAFLRFLVETLGGGSGTDAGGAEEKAACAS
jgi:DNA-binding transcriptional LysR family regulator